MKRTRLHEHSFSNVLSKTLVAEDLSSQADGRSVTVNHETQCRISMLLERLEQLDISLTRVALAGGRVRVKKFGAQRRGIH